MISCHRLLDVMQCVSGCRPFVVTEVPMVREAKASPPKIRWSVRSRWSAGLEASQDQLHVTTTCSRFRIISNGTCQTAYSGHGQMDQQSQKRQSIGDGGPPTKKFKGAPELPGDYSDAVRKKYQSASRTGQACDRCKVGHDPVCQSRSRVEYD